MIWWAKWLENASDINVLGTLASPDQMVTPLDACCVVPIHWRVRLLANTHVLDKVAEVDDLDCHL